MAQATYWWTTVDLDRLPEEPFLRYEIIDGQLIVSRRLHLGHAIVRAHGGKLLAEPGLVWSMEAEDNRDY